MIIDHMDALDMLSDAYVLLCEMADTIENSLEGDHPDRQAILNWIENYEERRDA
jgi:hypothetical protein